jgi:hypothetical protein
MVACGKKKSSFRSLIPYCDYTPPPFGGILLEPGHFE